MAENGEAASAFFNPAGLTQVKGISLAGAVAEPFYAFQAGEYFYGTLAWNAGKKGTIGLSRYFFDSGESFFTGNLGFSIEAAHYALSYAYKLRDYFSIGVTLNFMKQKSSDSQLQEDLPDRSIKYADIGLLKSFSFAERGIVKQKLDVAYSIINVTYSKARTELELFEDIEDKMPVVLRLGASYQLEADKKLFFDNLTTLQLSSYGEYQDVLNFDWRTGFKFGVEATLFELLSLRTGYFSEKQISGDEEESKSRWTDMTYGFGIKVPFNKITGDSFPLSFRYDYVNMPQPLFTKTNRFNLGNFSVNTITLGWDFNKSNN